MKKCLCYSNMYMSSYVCKWWHWQSMVGGMWFLMMATQICKWLCQLAYYELVWIVLSCILAYLCEFRWTVNVKKRWCWWRSFVPITRNQNKRCNLSTSRTNGWCWITSFNIWLIRESLLSLHLKNSRLILMSLPWYERLYNRVALTLLNFKHLWTKKDLTSITSLAP